MSVRVESVRLNVDDVDWVGIAFEDTRVRLLLGFETVTFVGWCLLHKQAIKKKKRSVHVTARHSQCGRTADSLPRKNWEKRKKQTATPLNDLA